MKVIINNELREINADIMKLANTIWNKSGDKYTEKEMFDMGFKKINKHKLNKMKNEKTK